MDELPIPDKLSFKIGEAAQLVGVQPHVLRFWEQQFRRLRPQKARNGHRIYSHHDIHLLRRIRTLLHSRGFTIAGAKALLKEGEAAVEAAISARPVEAQNKLEESTVALRSAERAVKDCRAEIQRLERALRTAKEEAEFWKTELHGAETKLSALSVLATEHLAALRASISAPEPVD